jgi:hypothetical protein
MDMGRPTPKGMNQITNRHRENYNSDKFLLSMPVFKNYHAAVGARPLCCANCVASIISGQPPFHRPE